METYEGWAPDPFGAHEARYFSLGRPTRLVRDGSVETFDEFPGEPTGPPPVPGYGEPAGPGGPSDAFEGVPAPVPSGHPGRRLVAVLTTLVAAAVAGSLLLVLGGSRSAEAAVIDSVNSTMASRTAHVSMNLTVHTPTATVSGSGTGGIDFGQNAVQLQMNVGEAGRQIPVQAVFFAGSVYEQIPDLDRLIPGKSWISIDVSSLGAAQGQDPGALGTGNNPMAMLRLLAQQGNTVVPIGSSSIGGTPVQGYSVAMDGAAIQARLAHADLPSWMTAALSHVDVQTVTDKVYVDDAGLLRRMSVELTETVASAGKVSVDESLDFSDYGAPVSVTAPPSDQVVSLDQLMQDALAAHG